MTALEKARPWDHLLLWPKSPGWLAELAETSSLCRTIAESIGPIVDSDGAIEFRSNEIHGAVALLGCAAAFGWSWPEDLYVLTDSRDVVFMLDHHHALWAKFKDGQRCDQFVADMEQAELPLPDSPPDATFKPMSWMTGKRGT